jgi:hypothetical protein
MTEPLNKDPFALDEASEGSVRRWLPWVLGTVLLILLGGSWYLWQSMSDPKPRQTLSSAPKPGMTPSPGASPAPASGPGGGIAAGSPAQAAAGAAGAAVTGAGPAGLPAAGGSAAAPGGGLPGMAANRGPGDPADPAGRAGTAGSGAAGGDGASAGVARYPIERSLAGSGPIDPGTATLDPPAADKAINNALSSVPGREQILRFALPSEVVRRFVLTIDNLPGDTMSMQYRAVNAIGGPLRVERRGPATYLAATNASRYDDFVRMAASIDTKRLVGLYKRFYPLFQQEYSSIGYPDRHFNDRLVEAIDDMLAAPNLEGPAELIQPRILYEYADPALERRSVGQRMLMRMGPDHAQRLKAKLREIRTALTNETR